MSAPNSIGGIQALNHEQEASVRAHLEEIMASRAFAGSRRAQDFLRLIVEHALAGEIDCLRERMIGAEMFNRPIDYDTANDAVVRVKASELRKKLAQFYLESTSGQATRIEVPPGCYVPRFVFTAPEDRIKALREIGVATTSADSPASSQKLSADATLDESLRGSQGPRRGGSLWAMGIAAGFCLAGILVAFGLKDWKLRSSASPPAASSATSAPIRSLAVLTFQNDSGDPTQDYFADGMTEELIANLGRFSALRVIPRTSTVRFKSPRFDLPEIARELSVEGIVEGSVRRQGSDVQITVRLMDATAGRPIWEETFTRHATDILASEEELAEMIASKLGLTVSPQARADMARSASTEIEAEDFYFQGLEALHAGNNESALDYLQKAVQADPKFASGYVALARCYEELGSGGWMPYAQAFSKAKSNAAIAIRLDDSLSEGHAEMAGTLIASDWDWRRAEKEYHRALELNPNSAIAHLKYADYLDLKGESAAAIAEGQIAVRLDPLSSRALADLAYIYYFSREYDQALSLLKEAKIKDPNLHPDIFVLGDIYTEKGMYREAIDEFLKLGDNPQALGHLANAYARAGRQDIAQKILAQLEERVQQDGLGAYEIALTYTGLGQKNNAFEWLAKALADRDRGIIFLKVDPLLDPLRSDAQFNQIMQRVGFTQ